MPLLIVIAAVAIWYAGYRFGKRRRWLEPHCYCRTGKEAVGHACLHECWIGQRTQHGWSKSFLWYFSLPCWRRWLHTYR